MNNDAQIQEAATAVAARLEIKVAELARLCKTARRAGWRSKLDQLTTVLLAAARPPGSRGPVPADALVAGIYENSPARLEDRAARLRAEVARRCRVRGRWWDQCRAVVVDEKREEARQEARKMFPGRGRAAVVRRTRYVRAQCGPMHKKRGGGAA